MKSPPPWVGRLLLGWSAVSAVVFLVALVAGKDAWLGPSLTSCFLSLALAAWPNPKLRKLSFTIWIVTGVAVGMSFPMVGVR